MVLDRDGWGSIRAEYKNNAERCQQKCRYCFRRMQEQEVRALGIDTRPDKCEKRLTMRKTMVKWRAK